MEHETRLTALASSSTLSLALPAAQTHTPIPALPSLTTVSRPQYSQAVLMQYPPEEIHIHRPHRLLCKEVMRHKVHSSLQLSG